MVLECDFQYHIFLFTENKIPAVDLGRRDRRIMNQLLNKLERRFGKYAVPDLIKYVIVLYCAGAALGLINEEIYYNYLALNIEAVLHGQVWRLVTYLIEPYGFNQGMGFIVSILFFAIQVNLFFLFGRSLERAWGTFRFNMYFISGWLLNIVAAFILYGAMHSTYYMSGFQYIYWSMFFAFAAENPDMEFLFWFVLPIKVKWLAILDAVYLVYNVIGNIARGISCMDKGMTDVAGAYFSVAFAIVVAMANFLVYFLSSRNYRRISPGDVKRRRKFKKQVQQVSRRNGGARHCCAVCGRTELDDDSLDFRYCSKCEGNYEYCSEHLFTHQHVRKHDQINLNREIKEKNNGDD